MSAKRSRVAELTNRIANRQIRLTSLRGEVAPSPLKIYELEIDLAALRAELAASASLGRVRGGGPGRDVNPRQARRPSNFLGLFTSLGVSEIPCRTGCSPIAQGLQRFRASRLRSGSTRRSASRF